MAYLFSSHPRLTLGFDTPNQGGAALGMAVCAICGIVLHPSWPARPAWQKAALAGLVGLGFLGIALTYSRGAYVAVVGTLAILGAFSSRRKAPVWGLAAGFLIVVLLIPGGWSRVEMAGGIKDDMSVQNRLVLWKSGLAMAWDSFPRGVGAAEFGKTFTAWYQPAEKFQVYTTGVSDYVTIAGYHGLAALAGYGWLLGWIAVSGIRFIMTADSLVLSAGIPALICHAIAGLFSTLLFSPVAALAGGTALAVAGAWLCHPRRAAGERRPKAGWGLMLSGVLTAGVVVGSAALCAWASPTRRVAAEQAGLAPRDRLQVLRPRHGAHVGTACVVLDRWVPEQDARNLARPVAEAGFETVSFAPVDFGTAGAAEVEALLHELAKRRTANRPLFVLGHGEAVRLVLSRPESLQGVAGVIGISGVYWHPVATLSPLEQLPGIRCALLVLHDPADQLHNPSEAHRFLAAAQAAGKCAALATFSDPEGDADLHWSPISASILPFLKSHANPPKSAQ